MSLWVITVRDRECGEFLNAIGPLNTAHARCIYDELMQAQRVLRDVARVELPDIAIEMLRMEDPSPLLNPNNTDG